MASGTYLGALLCGPVSRSNAVVVAHRAVRDGYGPWDAFASAIAADREQFVAAESGFAFVSGGQADWLDGLRPLARAWSGFNRRESSGEDAVGPVTRWFRTNTFYRKPQVVSRLDCRGDELAAALPSVEKGVVFLPGPFTFCELVDDAHYRDAERLARDYAAAVANSVPALKQKGYACVLWLEPAVGYLQSKKSFGHPAWLASAYPRLEGIASGIHLPLADAGPLLPLLEGAAVDFVGVDALYTPARGVQTQKDLLVGMVDAARVGVESFQQLDATVKAFVTDARFSGRYYVGTNDRLFDVPFDVGLQKTRALGKVGA